MNRNLQINLIKTYNKNYDITEIFSVYKKTIDGSNNYYNDDYLVYIINNTLAKLPPTQQIDNNIIKKTLYENHSKLKQYIQTNMSGICNNYSMWEYVFNNIIVDYMRNELFQRNQKIDDVELFKLFDLSFMSRLVINLIELYNKKYRDGWFLDKIPDLLNDNSFGEKLVIDKNANVLIIGDTHSSIVHLWKVIEENKNMFEPSTLKLKPNNYIILTGDMVDYGPYGVEIVWFLLTLKYINFEQVHLINGNHEDYQTYSIRRGNGPRYFNFDSEMNSQIKTEDDKKTKKNLMKILYLLPSAIFLRYSDDLYYYQLNHGALILTKSGFNRDKNDFSNYSELIDFLNTTNTNTLIDLENDVEVKWGDFRYMNNNNFYDTTPYIGNDPQTGRFYYSPECVNDYISKNFIRCIISGHQDLINFGISPPYSKTKFIPKIKLSDNESIQWNPETEFISTKSLLTNDLTKERYQFEIKPTTEFNACVLSNAVVPKYLPFICYAKLVNSNNAWLDTKKKYLKYKLKYLKLKKI